MKIFLFISYLWILAFTQTLFASNDKQQPTTSTPTQSAPYKETEKLFCREDVSPEALPDYSGTVAIEEMGCDQVYADRQVRISEDRDRHEYRVWSEISPIEMSLGQYSYESSSY